MAHAKGLRDRRVMTRYAGRNAILPPLNGFAAQFAGAVGGLVFIEYVFSYPGAGLTLQQAALGNDYPLTQALLLVFAFCVIAANFIMDLAQLRPRPARARQLMSQLQPIVEPELAPLSVSAPRKRGRLHVPGWLTLLLANPKSRFGLSCSSLHGRRRGDRAVDLGRQPDRLQHPRHAAGAVVAPPVRHDRPGQRHLLAGRARHPALADPRRRRGAARDDARRDARDPRRVRRRHRRRGRQLPDERLPRHPDDPAA